MDNPLIGEFLASLSDAVRSGRMNLVQTLLDWSNAEAAHAFRVAASSKQWEVAKMEVEDGDDTDDEQVQKVAVPPLSKGRKQFVSADDILLLTQVLQTKPWAFQHVMDGWQQVSDQLRAHDEFRLEKTAGACQARVVLLLDHLRAGNAAALRKAGTSDEYERKRELLVEVQAKQTAFEEVQEVSRYPDLFAKKQIY
ncbi:hypothetical protein PRNP1_004536 [Phytophthora ramorum]